jgi:hypothetical protein
MKTSTFNTIRKIVFGISAAVMLLSLTSCAKNINFLNSSVVPAARGSVKVKKDNNNNYLVQVEIFNLAEVGRLEPARKTYIVWVDSDGQPAKNVGQMKSSTGFLSKKLRASLETISSAKPEKVFITAENDSNVQYPSSQVVLSTNNF